MKRCRDCGHLIDFVRLPASKRHMPIEPRTQYLRPDPHGTDEGWTADFQKVQGILIAFDREAEELERAKLLGRRLVRVYVSHFGLCERYRALGVQQQLAFGPVVANSVPQL